MSDAIQPEVLPIPQGVEKARERDRRIQRLSYIAWGTTLLVIAILAVYEISNLSMGHRVISGEAGPGLNDLWLTLRQWSPVVRTIGVFALVAGLFSSFVVLLRFRTASLTEIQTRLAAIEETLIERGE